MAPHPPRGLTVPRRRLPVGHDRAGRATTAPPPRRTLPAAAMQQPRRRRARGAPARTGATRAPTQRRGHHRRVGQPEHAGPQPVGRSALDVRRGHDLDLHGGRSGQHERRHGDPQRRRGRPRRAGTRRARPARRARPSADRAASGRGAGHPAPRSRGPRSRSRTPSPVADAAQPSAERQQSQADGGGHGVHHGDGGDRAAQDGRVAQRGQHAPASCRAPPTGRRGSRTPSNRTHAATRHDHRDPRHQGPGGRGEQQPAEGGTDHERRDLARHQQAGRPLGLPDPASPGMAAARAGYAGVATAIARVAATRAEPGRGRRRGGGHAEQQRESGRPGSAGRCGRGRSGRRAGRPPTTTRRTAASGRRRRRPSSQPSPARSQTSSTRSGHGSDMPTAASRVAGDGARVAPFTRSPSQHELGGQRGEPVEPDRRVARGVGAGGGQHDPVALGERQRQRARAASRTARRRCRTSARRARTDRSVRRRRSRAGSGSPRRGSRPGR